MNIRYKHNDLKRSMSKQIRDSSETIINLDWIIRGYNFWPVWYVLNSTLVIFGRRLSLKISNEMVPC